MASVVAMGVMLLLSTPNPEATPCHAMQVSPAQFTAASRSHPHTHLAQLLPHAAVPDDLCSLQAAVEAHQQWPRVWLSQASSQRLGQQRRQCSHCIRIGWRVVRLTQQTCRVELGEAQRQPGARARQYVGPCSSAGMHAENAAGYGLHPSASGQQPLSSLACIVALLF